MLEAGTDDPLGTLCGCYTEVHGEVVRDIDSVASQCVASLGVLPVENPVDSEFGNGYRSDISEQVQFLPHGDVGALDVRPGVSFLGRCGRSLEDHVAFFQCCQCVVGDGLHDLDTPLDGQSVDLSDLHLSCFDLVCEQDFHDLLGGCADVRSDTVTSAYSDDEFVQFGIVCPVGLILEYFDPLELLPEQDAELLLCRLDCFLVNHCYRACDCNP